MKYQLVIFDFDGTLADSFSWFLTVYEDLAKHYKLPHLERAELENLRSRDIRQILKEYHIPFWKMFVIGNHLKELMSAQINRINLVSGMQTVMETLAAQDVRMAVVTSNAEENVCRVLGPQNMALIDAIESGVSMYGKKNKFRKILKKTGVPAQRALSIGDEIRDLRSSRAASIAFGAVSWGYTDLSILQALSPDEVFAHPAQILDAVNRLPS